MLNCEIEAECLHWHTLPSGVARAHDPQKRRPHGKGAGTPGEAAYEQGQAVDTESPYDRAQNARAGVAESAYDAAEKDSQESPYDAAEKDTQESPYDAADQTGQPPVRRSRNLLRALTTKKKKKGEISLYEMADSDLTESKIVPKHRRRSRHRVYKDKVYDEASDPLVERPGRKNRPATKESPYDAASAPGQQKIARAESQYSAAGRMSESAYSAAGADEGPEPRRILAQKHAAAEESPYDAATSNAQRKPNRAAPPQESPYDAATAQEQRKPHRAAPPQESPYDAATSQAQRKPHRAAPPQESPYDAATVDDAPSRVAQRPESPYDEADEGTAPRRLAGQPQAARPESAYSAASEDGSDGSRRTNLAGSQSKRTSEV
jgi:hypothetical protein